MGHTVTACEASVRLEGSRSGEQLRKTRERRKQEPKSRGLGITVLPGR
ncbi:Mobile element protein [Geitlerinema sp. FC II]|nr:Mobile element protein [Geitlerinema sp. FC II]